MIRESNRQLAKDNLSIIIEKFKQKEFKKLDDSFLIGFYEGYRSETGIPNQIQKPIIKNKDILI